MGWQAALTVRGSPRSWWVADGWSRPLVVAPFLLLARGLQVGYWHSLLLGLVIGAAVGTFWAGRPQAISFLLARRRLVVVALFIFAALLVFGSGIRIYQQTGVRFPEASDDGPSYFHMAAQMADDPRLFFTSKLDDENYFSGYYPAMALWFRAVGPHIPSWLLWHGVAGGLLALILFGLGRMLAGPGWGLLGVMAILADRVILHLMATMNMETFFLPSLFLGLWLWVRAAEERGRRGISLAAGLLLGLATIFRPTAVLLPVLLAGLVLLEQTESSWRVRARQVGWMVGGFVVALIPLLLRHRIAWGYWTLSGVKATVSSRLNYALEVHGQHLLDVGLVNWLSLVAADPAVIWQRILPGWWDQGLYLWTHRGFGQMDLIQGLNHRGPYQAALATMMMAAVVVGAALAVSRRHRLALALLALPVYFTSLVLGFYVLNSRYRAPFIPALYLLAVLGLAAASRSQSLVDANNFLDRSL